MESTLELGQSAPANAHDQATELEDQPSMPLQFVTEFEDGKRARPGSKAMFTVRSNARRYAASQRRKEKDRLQNSERQTRITPIFSTAKSSAAGSNGPSSDNMGERSLRVDFEPGQCVVSRMWKQGEILRVLRSLGNDQDLETDIVLSMPPSSGDTVEPLVRYQPHVWVRPQEVLGAGRVDPFQSYPIRTTQHIHKLVDHYVVFISTSQVPTVDPKAEKPAPALQRLSAEFLTLCMGDSMSFHGLLLASEVALQSVTGHEPWSFEAIKHLNECLARLRKYLENPEREVSDTVIASVVLLASVEFAFGRDIVKFENHMRGLVEMVKLRGGLENLSGILQDKVIWAYKIYARVFAREGYAEVDGRGDTIVQGQGGNLNVSRTPLPRSMVDWPSWTHAEMWKFFEDLWVE